MVGCGPSVKKYQPIKDAIHIGVNRAFLNDSYDLDYLFIQDYLKGENDMGSADLIISIRTGQVITTVLLIITSIVILGIAIYFVRKLIINRNLM